MDVESRFLAAPGKGEVSAIFRRPANTDCILVLAHGAGAGMRHRNMEALADSLAACGIGTFRYQFPFMERGGGRDSLATSISTVRAAVEAARQAADGLPLMAGGHSFGGRMTSHAAVQPAAPDPMQGLVGLVYFNFPLHPPGKPSTDRAAHLGDVRVPQLFVSGTRDALARLDLLQSTLDGLGPDARMHLNDTADHSFKILKRTRQSVEDPIGEASRVTREWFDSLQPTV